MRHLTLGYLTIGDATPQEIVDAAAFAGFRSVGLRVVGRRANDAFPDLIGNPGGIAKVRKSLSDSGLRLANVTGNYLVANSKAADLRALAETGAELGSAYVAVSGYDDDHNRLADNFACLTEESARVGLKVAFEFVPYSTVINFQQAYDIMIRANHPGAGLRIDALHHIRSGGSPADFAKADPARVFYFQICDGPLAAPPTLDERMAESRSGRFYPGEGEFPLFAFLDALPADVEIEIETPHPNYRLEKPAQRAQRANRALMEFIPKYEAHRHARDQNPK